MLNKAKHTMVACLKVPQNILTIAVDWVDDRRHVPEYEDVSMNDPSLDYINPFPVKNDRMFSAAHKIKDVLLLMKARKMFNLWRQITATRRAGLRRPAMQPVTADQQ